MNLVLLQRSVRRFFESSVSGRRVQKRIAFGGCLALLVVVYVFLVPSGRRSPPASEQCAADEFGRLALGDLFAGAAAFSTAFVGNGFVGVETATDRQILVAARPDSPTIKTPIFTSFRPLVDVALPFDADGRVHHVLDFNRGVSMAIQCASFSDKCFCVRQFVYAHRIRPNIIVQEISVSNPTTSFLNLQFNRRGNADWDQTSIGTLPPIFFKTFDDSQSGRVVVAVVCSAVPIPSVSIRAQTFSEETFRFLCVVDEVSVERRDEKSVRRKLVEQITAHFNQVNGMTSSALDKEHSQAWNTLNSAVFNIDHSKAPGALNSQQINVTHHALLSVLRAPLLEVGADTHKTPMLFESLARTELCYSGHSTLLIPSKLWQDWTNVQELLRTIEIWLLTLEHNGCVHMLEAGANGAAQAFLLSLLAATFTHHRLEVALDPEADLHRQLHVQNLRVGGSNLALYFNLDAAYKPYVEVKIVGNEDSGALRLVGTRPPAGLYACGAGCLETPLLLGRSTQRLALKVTKPPTPILYVAEDRQHLSQLKNTLHVSEVVDAPSPETEKVDLHKHGENSGLPIAFWAIFIFTVIAFHLFLFRLLYSEWQNSSSIPYTKFSKRFLLKR